MTFAELLAEGPTFAWPPGVVFEYSNLGYGILGRVITTASGREYREFVRDRILAPLGMTSTGYLAAGGSGGAPRPRLCSPGRDPGPGGHRPVRGAGLDGRRVHLDP